jgi:minor extracellular serine protease Vpr
MRRRVSTALAIAALVFGAVAPGASVAASTPIARFQRISISKIDPKLLPALIDPNRVVDVIVQLADQPVASHVGDAKDIGATVTKSQKDGWRTQIQANQKPVVDAVHKSGGVVISQMQDAYNGIHVHVKAGQLTTLAAMSGVSGIHLVPIYKPALTESVPYVGAPQAWTTTGITGAGTKIAVIDTGVDYYHADFGGSGNPADYAYGLAHDTTVPAFNADGTTVAFPSAKIPVGYDFVGDAYDASAPAGSPATIPHPDGNPLDCNSHGTHTASTAAGEGVLSTGATYTGPYNSSIYGTTDFRIGPGVAPQASLYIYRVFGCTGSTDVVTEAINRAVLDGADVISMSLGSDFGTSDTPDAVAADNASRAGVVVVAASGNSGPNAYMTSTPGSSSRTISVAALDSNATFPGATIHLTSGDIAALNANNAPLPVTGRLDVLTSGGAISLGCDSSDYAGVLPGDIVVTMRGTCARVLRAELGQAAGAAAVIMVNSSAGLPPFEGPIPGVHIPFIGVEDASGPALLAAAGDTVTISSAGMMANPTYKDLADFSSWGPRFGDSALKPEVTAPGVSIVAAGMGTGSDVLVDSGTSMATPHVAGVAALVIAAHPNWSVNEVKAAIMSTADDSSAKILGYNPVGAGSGVVQAQLATTTAAIALTQDKLDSLSFDNVALGGPYAAVRTFTIENKSSSPITYNLSAAFIGSPAGAKVSVFPSKVTVPAHQFRIVATTLSMTAAAVKALPFADTFAGVGPGSVLTVTGVVTATPTASRTGVYPLHIPFLVVPRGLSNVFVGPTAPYQLSTAMVTANVKLVNAGIHTGTADVYSWGIFDKDHTAGISSVRAVGVQSQLGSFCGTGLPDTDRCLVFAVNGWHQWSNASGAEFDIAIDTNGDGVTDYLVVSLDLGAVLTGAFNGVDASFTFDRAGNLIDAFYADAPMNGSVIELPALAGDMGISAASAAFHYTITGFDLGTGAIDSVPGKGAFNAFSPSVSNGQFVVLNPGARANLPLSVDPHLQATTPALGWMIVSLDNPNGPSQAALLPIGKLPKH